MLVSRLLPVGTRPPSTPARPLLLLQHYSDTSDKQSQKQHHQYQPRQQYQQYQHRQQYQQYQHRQQHQEYQQYQQRPQYQQYQEHQHNQQLQKSLPHRSQHSRWRNSSSSRNPVNNSIQYTRIVEDHFPPWKDPNKMTSFDTLSRDACYRCGKTGHISRDCRSSQVCYNCGLAGHKSRDCQAPTAPKSCFGCGDTGHILRFCPKVAPKDAYDQQQGQAPMSEGYFHSNDMSQHGRVGGMPPGARHPHHHHHMSGVPAYHQPGQYHHHPQRPMDNQLGGPPRMGGAPGGGRHDPRGAGPYAGPPGSGASGGVVGPYMMSQMGGGAGGSGGSGGVGPAASGDGRSFHRARSMRCFVCGNFGHIARQCSSELICFNCGATGHIGSKCPEPPAPRDLVCFRCNSIGHVARDCVTNPPPRTAVDATPGVTPTASDEAMTAAGRDASNSSAAPADGTPATTTTATTTATTTTTPGQQCDGDLMPTDMTAPDSAPMPVDVTQQ